MNKLLLLAAAAAVSLLSPSAWAERPIEPHESATHVVVGAVVAVYRRDSAAYKHYVVEIQIEQVEHGRDLSVGHTMYAACYQRRPGKYGLEADSAGHLSVPDAGQRVRVFLSADRGRYEGVHPDWVEVLEPRVSAQRDAS